MSLADACDQPFGSAALDEARCDRVDADAVRGEFVGQALAVGRKRGFGGRLGKCRVVEGHFPLDRGDVDDGSGPCVDHRWD
jgi:hypothetical protein